MKDTELRFENYLADIPPDFAPIASDVHALMEELGCTVKLQAAKSGHVVSYNHPKTKKVLANLVSRKKGPVLRLYSDRCSKYPELVSALPDSMLAEIEKAPVCKRLHDPTKCSSRCAMGFQIEVKGELHKKCRYGLQFALTQDSLEPLKGLLRREFEERATT